MVDQIRKYIIVHANELKDQEFRRIINIRTWEEEYELRKVRLIHWREKQLKEV